jgi:hypothetical protein
MPGNDRLSDGGENQPTVRNILAGRHRRGILLYDLRLVQHHVAQLNLILRQRAGPAPSWIRKTDTGL